MGWLAVVLFSMAVSPCEQEDKTKGPTRVGAEGGVEKGPNGSEVIVPAGSLAEPIDIEITREPAPRDLVPPEGAEVFSDVYVVRSSHHVFAPNPNEGAFIIKIPLRERVSSGDGLCAAMDLAASLWCEDISGEDIDPSGGFVLFAGTELYGPDSPAVIALPNTTTELKFLVFRTIPVKLPQVAPQRASTRGRSFDLQAPDPVSRGQIQTALAALDESLETYRRFGFPEPRLRRLPNSGAYRADVLSDSMPPCTKSALLGRYEIEPVQDNTSRNRAQWPGRLLLCARSLNNPSLLKTTAAHELFHAVQRVYISWERRTAALAEGKPLLWLTEGSAEAMAGTVASGGAPQATDDYDPLSLKDSVLGNETRYSAQDWFTFLALSRSDSSFDFLKTALTRFGQGTDAVSALEASLAPDSIQKSYVKFAEERAYRHAYKIHAGETYPRDALAQAPKLFIPSVVGLNQPSSFQFPAPLTAVVLTLSSSGTRGEMTVSIAGDKPASIGATVFRELAGVSMGGETMSGLEGKYPGLGTTFTRAVSVVASASPLEPAGNITVTFSVERETGTITGTVSGSDGKPIGGAKITTTDGTSTFTAESGSDGRYALPKVPAGQRVITASLLGRKTTQEAKVIAGGTTTLNFTLPVSSTTVTAPPAITLNPPNTDQAKGLSTITGTIKGLDGTTAALIRNGEETLISVNSDGTFSRIIILQVGENIVRVRATNALGTTLSDPLTITYSPTTTGGKMALRVTLVWDTQTDQDLHVWTPSGAQVYFVTDQADGGELDVDNIRGFGPENVTFPVVKEGRYSVGTNYYSGSQPTNVIVRVSVNEGTDFEQALSFGPQLLTKSNGDDEYPVLRTTVSWWRVADVSVNAQGIARIDPPSETPLKQVPRRGRPKKLFAANGSL